MLGGSATLMAAGMGIAEAGQTGVMALWCGRCAIYIWRQCGGSRFIGGAVASAISRPIESLMEGYGVLMRLIVNLQRNT